MYFDWLFVFPWKENIIIPEGEYKRYSYVGQVHNSPQHPFPYPLHGIVVKPLTDQKAINLPFIGVVSTYTFHVHSVSLPLSIFLSMCCYEYLHYYTPIWACTLPALMAVRS